MNHDDISVKVKRISIKDGTSRSNKPYMLLTIHFINGYDLSVFIKDDQKFGIKDALQTKLDLDGMNLDELDQVD